MTNSIPTGLIAQIRNVVRQEVTKAIREAMDLQDDIIGIAEISTILGHCEDWCRRNKHRYPHHMVNGRIKAHRNKLIQYANTHMS